MRSTLRQRIRRCLGLAVMLPLLAYIALHVVLMLRRPPRTPMQQELFPGITYQRSPRSQPRPLMVHIVTVDLTAAHIDLLVTPGEPTQDETGTTDISAQTTTDFLQRYGLQVAINGSFFTPFYARNPFDFYPKAGDRVRVLGEAIANGRTYSRAHQDWAVLCILSDRRARIRVSRCPQQTMQGIAGRDLLAVDGEPRSPVPEDADQLFPRTAVAIDRTGETLWLIIVDGRQWLYSEGTTLAELTDIALALGADRVVNLDGGGSTTLAVAENERSRLLNAPIHTGLPMRQRPVANHLGIYAQPSAASDASGRSPHPSEK